MKRRRVLALGGLLLTCTIVSIDCSADHLILGENHAHVDPGTARREVVQLDGRTIECWVARSPGSKGQEPRALVLFFIGKGGRADEWIARVADAWGDWPVELWGMNYPGSGGSDGPVSLARVGPSALAVFDAVRTRAGSRPIFLQGGSFGTTVALSVAARRPVSGIILQNPPPLRQLILGQYGWWNLWLIAGPLAAQVPADLDSVANASRCNAPAVFILHGGDAVVPASYHQLVYDAYAGPKQVIDMPGASHDAPLTREAAAALSAGKRWMWEKAMEGASEPATSTSPR